MLGLIRIMKACKINCEMTTEGGESISLGLQPLKLFSEKCLCASFCTFSLFPWNCCDLLQTCGGLNVGVLFCSAWCHRILGPARQQTTTGARLMRGRADTTNPPGTDECLQTGQKSEGRGLRDAIREMIILSIASSYEIIISVLAKPA